jgi:hypothetical protein
MTARRLMTDYVAAVQGGDCETAFGYFAEPRASRATA